MIGDRRERQEGSRARERMADLICFLLAMFGQLLVRESKGSLLGVELDETGEKFLSEYLSLDDGKHLAELQEFEDTAIELDLIDQKEKHRPTLHQPPRVLYQIGVSSRRKSSILLIVPFIACLLRIITSLPRNRRSRLCSFHSSDVLFLISCAIV